MDFLNPHDAGVAVLAKTLVLKGQHIVVHPRMQPIELPPGMATIAVVRIERSVEPPAEEKRMRSSNHIYFRSYFLPATIIYWITER